MSVSILSILTISVNLQGVDQLLGTCASFDDVVVGRSNKQPSLYEA